jgi:hypothetical protein
MILSNRYNFLFVHIAKTGGSSMRSALNRIRWRDPLYPFQFICSRFSHMTGHRLGTKFPRHARIIAAKEMLPHDVFAKLFKFAFVRNPWDVQVSAYHHLLRDHPHLLAGRESFADYLRYRLDPERPWDYYIDGLSQPQVDYLIDLDGTILADFVGRFETLAEDYQHIADKIGIANPLPHRRQEKARKDYREYYSSELVDLVAQHYNRDIEAFNYRFE